MKYIYPPKQWLAKIGLLLSFMLWVASFSVAQNISTVAGDGTIGITGNGIGFTQGVAVDPAGNMYVATGNGHVIRKITPGGAHSTFAGTGTAGYSGDGGPATSATLNNPVDVFIANGGLFIADMVNRRIRRVDLTTNSIITVAGDGTTNITGSGIGGTQGVAVDGANNVYVATGTFGNIIRKVTAGGGYSNFAGTSVAGYSGDGGPAASATLNAPADVFIGNNALYIADVANRYIRKVDLGTNIITTVAGDGTAGITGNGIGFTQGVAVDGAGNIFVATGNGHVIRKITPAGVHTTLAGTGVAGYSGDGGPAINAQLNAPLDVTALGTDIYIPDQANRYIRKVTNVFVAPTTVSSIVRANATPTNLGTVNFTVTFAAAVTGLSASNFALTTTGVTGAAIGTLTGSGTTYNVAVATGTGSGTIRLDLQTSTGISPTVSNVPFTSGEVYTIDKLAPTVAITSSTAANNGSSSANPFVYAATFSEAVTGFTAAEVTVGNGTIGSFTAVSSTNYTFNVTPTANGAVTVSIAANVAQDGASNGNAAGTPSPYTITYSAPTTTVASVTRLTPSPTATTSVSYRVVFAAAVTGITVSNFALATTGSISGASVSSASGSGTTYTVTVNTGTGDGTLRLNVQNSTGIAPTVTNVPYTAGEVYTITKSFAAAPQLTIVGTGGTGSDVTAFVDVAQVLSGGTPFANGLQNNSFETHGALANGDYGYNPSGASWTFNAQSGIANQGSAFTPTTPIPNGIAVAFVQSNGSGNGQLQQNLAVPTGSSYQVSFQAAQRVCCTTLDQALNVFLNGVFIGNIQPGSSSYSTFTSATFAVTAPALTATITSGTAANGGSTSTSPIAYTVTFSQSVGSTFTASDVTLGNGTISGFSGSGTTYTFNVTPTANGAVTVNVLANVALDANNTGNTAAAQYSITYTQPVTATPVVTAPANGSTLTTATPAYSGTAVAGSTVTVYVDGASLGTTTADGAGNWTLNQPTALAQGVHTVYATAQTSGSAVSANSATNTFTVDSVRPSVAISSTAGASGGTTGTSPIPFTVTFSEGVTGFVAGDLTVTNGTVSGFAGSGTTYTFNVTPTTPGTATTVNVPANVAQDAATNLNTAAPSAYSLTFTAPTIAVAPTTLPNATVASAYSQTITASGGTAPYSFAITAGALPAGLTLSSAGVLSGTPTAGGTFSFTVRATDAAAAPGPYNGARAYTLVVAPATIVVAPTTLPNGTVASAYSQTITASGGTAPYSFAITAGALPAGLTLTLGGVLSGTPTGSGTFSFTVTATDASAGNGPYSGSRAYSLTIGSQPVTATPVVTLPTNGSTVNTTAPTYSGTAPASSTVTVYVDGASIGTVPADGAGNWTLNQPTALAQGAHTVYATAQTSGSAVSANSVTNTFTVDTVQPTVAIASTAGASGTTTTTSPIPFTVTFSEGVTGFVAGDLTVTNGTVSGFAGSGTTYTFNVTPTTPGTATTVNVPANVAQDAATNLNTASNTYALTYLPNSVAWNGSVSTDWFAAGNWTPSTVPTTTVDATIPTAPSGNRFPAIAAGTASVRNLTLNSGASLTQTGGTLNITANVTNNGTYQPTGGTANLGSTTLANILGSGNTRFWNLTIGANGAQSSTSASTSVQRLLTLNGNFTTNGNSFTLESNAANTALVVNNGSSAIVGTATVQRYIAPDLNPNLGYRHVSAPINNATVASLTTAGFTPVVNPNYNTSATPTAVVPFPTVYGYDQSRLATTTNNLADFDKGWFSPNALSDALLVGQGYTVNLAANQTWNFVGTPTNGTVTQALSRNSGATAAASGLQLVGNPYPSPLDWSLVSAADRPNVDGIIYTFVSDDPTNAYTGSYKFYSGGFGTISPVLPLGQGFFVKVSAGQTSGTLSLNNAHRVTSYTNPTYHRTTETRPVVHLTLHGAGKPQTDDAFVYFEAGATNGLDAEYDGLKLPNPSGLNLSSSISATERLCVNGLAPLTTTQRIVPLAVGVPAVGSYTLNAAEVLNLVTTPVYLRDKQTGAVVDLAQQPSYSFVVSNASALITSRFELVFSPQAPLATAPAALAAQVGVYPNPATTAAFVELPAALGRVAVSTELVDALGRTVRTQSLPAQGAAAHRLDLANLPTGVYTLHLATSAGVVVKKLVVQ